MNIKQEDLVDKLISYLEELNDIKKKDIKKYEEINARIMKYFENKEDKSKLYD